MPRKKTKKTRAKAVSSRKAKSKSRARIKARKVRAAAEKKSRKKRISGRGSPAELVAYETRGLGAKTGGQAGDTQGLSGAVIGGSESVKELLEEGQSYEAEVLEGVENARNADESEVKTHEVPEDDVPEEYRGKG
jgi:hypothetical protein